MHAHPLKVEPPPTRREIRAGRDPHIVVISTDQPAGIRGRSIAVMTGKGLQDAAWTRENRTLAARLVQCYNACIGIDDPAAALGKAKR